MNVPDARDNSPATEGSWRPPIFHRPRVRVSNLSDQPDQLREFGIVERQRDGRVILHVAAVRPSADPTILERLAGEIRGAETVEIRGSDWAAIREARAALRAAWDAEDREARRTLAATMGAQPTPGRCGSTDTKSGLPCRLAAGSGTDAPGEGRCRLHGGSTAQRDAARTRLLDRVAEVRERHRQAEASGIPLTAAERRAELVALRQALTAYRRPRRSVPSVSPSDAP